MSPGFGLPLLPGQSHGCASGAWEPAVSRRVKSVHRSAQRFALPVNGFSCFAALGGNEAYRCWPKGFVDCNVSPVKLEMYISTSNGNVFLHEQC